MPQKLKTTRISSNPNYKSSEMMLQQGTVTTGTQVNNIRYISFPVAFSAAPQVQLTPMKGTVTSFRVPSVVTGSFAVTSRGTPLYSAKVFRYSAYGSV